MINSNKKNKLIFITIPSFLTIFLPIFLISGPFLSDAAISICGLIFIFNSIKNKLYKYYINKYFFNFIIFYLIIITSSLLSKNIFYSLNTSFFYFRFVLFSLSTWFLLENNKKLSIYLFYMLFFCFFILICDGIFQYFYNYNILGYKLQEANRVSSFFGDELIMGSYLSRLAPLLVGLFLINKSFSQSKNFFFYTIFTLLGLAIFLSGERSSFFYYLLLILYLTIFLNNKKIKIFSILSLAIIFSLILYKPDTKSRIFTETLNQINNDNKTSKSFNFYSPVHEGHYNSAIKIFFDNKIFGIGPKMFRIICREDKYYVNAYSCSTHPHHTYIQLLAETGIVGFFYVFIILTYLFYIILKALIQKYFYNRFIFKEFQHCMIISFLITLSPFTPSGNFFNNWLNIVHFLPLGFYFYKNSKI